MGNRSSYSVIQSSTLRVCESCKKPFQSSTRSSVLFKITKCEKCENEEAEHISNELYKAFGDRFDCSSGGLVDKK